MHVYTADAPANGRSRGDSASQLRTRAQRAFPPTSYADDQFVLAGTEGSCTHEPRASITQTPSSLDTIRPLS